MGSVSRGATKRMQKAATSGDLWRRAVKDAFLKLDPRVLWSNPVMFVVEIGFVVTLLLCLSPDLFGGSYGPAQRGYNVVVAFVLLITVLFATFAEAWAEGRGRAQAESLRRTRTETPARLVDEQGQVLRTVSSVDLSKGDRVRVEAGELIPGDGEIVRGIGSVDESAITGESAPVIREAGGDFSSVVGGTRLLSDWLEIEIAVNPGESFLDQMIKLVEGAARQKTPNEIALTVLLAGLTLIFLVVIMTLEPMAIYLQAAVDIPTLVALLVCLIPTTIGALLSAIGIAGMDRVLRFNIIAKSGKAVEAAGDVNTLLLDKTGTITVGNRMAEAFHTVGAHTDAQVRQAAYRASLADDTPEGKSIVAFAEKQGEPRASGELLKDAQSVRFSAETRRSGLILASGQEYFKGAVDAISEVVRKRGGAIPADLQGVTDEIARAGGTPLAVGIDQEILGVIYLKDVVKPGIAARFADLRRMGIRTVMITGDNRLTAATIAKEAGVDDFIAEAKPEQKLHRIREEQGDGKMVAMTGDGTNDAPALAQADVGLAMQSGTSAAKDAANMVDLDSDPTKLIELVGIGKQLLITRGTITTFSIANDVAKYFAIIPAMFAGVIPQLGVLNIMRLTSPHSAILSALIFNALIIPALIPLAMRGVSWRPMSATQTLLRNVAMYGLGGVLVPFVGIKLIDVLVTVTGLARV